MANMIFRLGCRRCRVCSKAILLPLPNGAYLLRVYRSLRRPRSVKLWRMRCFPAMALPQKAALDALHIGLAAANGIEVLLTWNCAHIANPFMLNRTINAPATRGVWCGSTDDLYTVATYETQDNVERSNSRRNPEPARRVCSTLQP